MGILDFFTRNKKLFMIAGGSSLLAVVLIYLLTSDKEE